jgi:predicted  nucleic acid-binding Zn-ribbon protein
MSDSKATRDYRKNITVKLIEKYKDLIAKTFEVTNVDLLQEVIDAAEYNEKQKEEALLNAIKKRKTSLDEVDSLLDKIEKLEKNLIDIEKGVQENDGQPEEDSSNPNNKHIRKE